MGYHTFDVSFPCIIQLALFPKPMVLGEYETKRVKEDDDLSDRGKKNTKPNNWRSWFVNFPVSKY